MWVWVVEDGEGRVLEKDVDWEKVEEERRRRNAALKKLLKRCMRCGVNFRGKAELAKHKRKCKKPVMGFLKRKRCRSSFVRASKLHRFPQAEPPSE